MKHKDVERFDAHATPEMLALYERVRDIIRRRPGAMNNLRFEISVLEDAVRGNEMDVLAEALIHCATRPVHIVMLIVEALKDNGTYEQYAGNLKDEHFDAAAEVIGAIISVVRKDEYTAALNDELNKIGRYAVQHVDEAALIAGVLRERKIINLDETVGLVADIRKSGASSLSEGLL